LPVRTWISIRSLSMSVVSNAASSLTRSPAPYASMKIARYLSDVAASNWSTSDPLRISGDRRGTFACGSPAEGSRPSVERNTQRIARGAHCAFEGRSRRESACMYCSTSFGLIDPSGLPIVSMKCRAYLR
jgi:hypothetical protein